MAASQIDLFDRPVLVEKRCGTCVVLCRKWDFDTDKPRAHGSCSRYGERHEDDEACDQWFGVTELGKALYGGRRK